MSVALLWLCLFNLIGHQPPDRYFKEDHLTGADYIWLGADHTYRVTGREHMGIWVFESGRWEHSDGANEVRADGRNKEVLHGH